MKKLALLIICIILSVTVMIGQGIRKKDGIKTVDIPVYSLASGSTEWVVGLEYGEDCSYRWDIQLDISGLTGVLDGTLAIFKSSNAGKTWIPYPNMETQTITADDAYGFDDPAGTSYDQIKVVLTVVGITGGSVSVNERLVTIPNKQ
jgi:hypothetical protein